MTRIILSLDERDKAWLKEQAIRSGVSMAEVIREAVGRMRRAEEESLEQALAATRGIWRDGDGLRYQRRIRREWDERLTRLGDSDRSSKRRPRRQ